MSKPAPKPPEPDDGAARVAVAFEADRVQVNFKVTDKWGDVFVSTDVGYASSMLPEDGGDPVALYKRVAKVTNEMYQLRRAEVREAFGKSKTPRT